MNTYVGLTDSKAEYLSELMTTVESDGEYEDVVLGSSKRRKAKDSNTPHFSWRSDNEFVLQYHAYDSTNAGFRLLSDLEDENNFLQYFQCYFTEELVQKIATESRFSFKQHIRSKRHRFSVKFFVLTDVETDYVLDFIIYTGATTDLDEVYKSLGISGAVVYTLIKPYLEKGHNLFTDNWYTSPTLAEYLHEHKTNLCGTVRNNRKGMPKLEKKLKQGEVITQHTDKIMARNNRKGMPKLEKKLKQGEVITQHTDKIMALK
ncbi:Transposase IS4 [Popillia japonica]|uniref:Transposase IS4 n=1 Tax=Popillia japonica TaxID=7064 RepID=A0AAW1JEG4_POPJA